MSSHRTPPRNQQRHEDNDNYFVCMTPERNLQGGFTGHYNATIGSKPSNQSSPSRYSSIYMLLGKSKTNGKCKINGNCENKW